MTTTAPQLLLSPAEAARALSLSEKTLWNRTAPRGDIPARKIGRLVRYSLADLQRWIEQPNDDPANN